MDFGRVAKMTTSCSLLFKRSASGAGKTLFCLQCAIVYRQKIRSRLIDCRKKLLVYSIMEDMLLHHSCSSLDVSLRLLLYLLSSNEKTELINNILSHL